MKELFQLWNKVRGRRYSSVDTADRELRDFNNRLKNIDLGASNYGANLSECEELNKNKCDNEFNGVKISKRRSSTINKPQKRK